MGDDGEFVVIDSEMIPKGQGEMIPIVFEVLPQSDVDIAGIVSVNTLGETGEFICSVYEVPFIVVVVSEHEDVS
jgi:hypothetical protein